MKPSKSKIHTIELTPQDMSVLVTALDYCEATLPQYFKPDEVDELRQREHEPSPIVIEGDSARLAIGAISLLAEDRSEDIEGEEALKVLQGYQQALHERFVSSTPA